MEEGGVEYNEMKRNILLIINRWNKGIKSVLLTTILFAYMPAF